MKLSEERRRFIEEYLEHSGIREEELRTIFELKEAEKEKARQEQIQQEKHIQQVVKNAFAMELPLDFDSSCGEDPDQVDFHTEDLGEALLCSLDRRGQVDIEWISRVTNRSYKEVIVGLNGAIYQNPDTWGECFYRGWEMADEYLSGNLIEKYRGASAANQIYKGYFQDNVEALRRILPETVDAEKIYVTIGSPWVSEQVIDEFISYIYAQYYKGTIHDEYTGSWEIQNNYMKRGLHKINRFGTRRMSAIEILQKTLNQQKICVYDIDEQDIRIINTKETMLANEKQKLMIQEFQRWIWRDPTRKKALRQLYTEKYGAVRKRQYDGSFLSFSGLSPNVSLYPYQKNAVARILFSPNTLLAHDVGAGKTYIMIAAGMELRRLKRSRKNLYVVPNGIVEQWERIFREMYSNAELLVVSPRQFTPDKRKKMLETIRDREWDGIIMAYSCFEQITVSREFQSEQLQKMVKAMDRSIEKGKETRVVKRLKKQITKKLSALEIAIEADNGMLTLDELGISRLFLDEAHNYKNVPFRTNIKLGTGIHPEGSAKCEDMMRKVHLIQKQNDGQGVVFATGTPISNSISDLYMLQKYLQQGTLEMLGIQSFDAWIGLFAELSNEFEVDVDTKKFRVQQRFTRFHNLSELTRVFSLVADFHGTSDSENLPRPVYQTVKIPKTKQFDAFLEQVGIRVENVRSKRVSYGKDNMLKITVDGRKAALDLRLTEGVLQEVQPCKIEQCAQNIWQVYQKTRMCRGTQIVFCDLSVPKAGFNVYDELKRILMMKGIPEEKIAFIHDANTLEQRRELASKMEEGDIAVLIGSTFRMGVGMNIQKRLAALHHLDIPWRPADVTQREGRIIRQGNLNQEVYIFRYITEGSFDAYSWQLLETKQRIIDGLLSGYLTKRSTSDVADSILSYGEVKALAIGNPLMRERVEKVNELSRLLVLQEKSREERFWLSGRLEKIPGEIREQKQKVTMGEKDIERYVQCRRKYNSAQRAKIREQIGEYVRGEKLGGSIAYQGFTLEFPDTVFLKEPYVWVRGDGSYYLRLSEDAAGSLARVDHFLENLPEKTEEYRTKKRTLEEEQKSIRQDLSRFESYYERVEACLREIKRLDEELGVDLS